MLKQRATLIFLLLCGAAHAQTPGVCAGISASGPATLTEAAPTWVVLPCLPDFLGGTGRGYNLRVSPAGVVPWLWCPNGTGWALRWAAATWADAAPIAAELPAALASSDKRAALTRIGDAHLSRDIGEPELKALWCPHWSAMAASRPGAVAGAWSVAPASASANPPATRPTYRYTAPATLALDGQRIAQGSACDCARASYSPSTSTRYCSVLGLQTKVALCVSSP